MSFTSWLKSQTKKGLVPDPPDDRDLQDQLTQYYYTYNTDSTTSGSNTISQTDLNNLYKSMQTSSTVSSGFTNTYGWDHWTKQEKQALAKVGFEYDEVRNEWKLKLTAEIAIPQLEGIVAGMHTEGGTPTNEAIHKMKQLKEMLIEKLTAKIVLAELVRPRKIEGDDKK